MTDGITIIYDGECPFCASYVALMTLRKSVGTVDLIDARSDDSRVLDAAKDDLDLDEGMVVLWDGQRFHGSDAAHLLATLSGSGGAFNALQRGLLGGPRRAALIYPCLARGRRLVLRLLGRSPIGRTKKTAPTRE